MKENKILLVENRNNKCLGEKMRVKAGRFIYYLRAVKFCSGDGKKIQY